MQARLQHAGTFEELCSRDCSGEYVWIGVGGRGKGGGRFQKLDIVIEYLIIFLSRRFSASIMLLRTAARARAHVATWRIGRFVEKAKDRKDIISEIREGSHPSDNIIRASRKEFCTCRIL